MLFLFLECSHRHFHGLISPISKSVQKNRHLLSSPCLTRHLKLQPYLLILNPLSLRVSPLSLLAPNILCTLHAHLYKHTLYFTHISSVCLSSPNHIGLMRAWQSWTWHSVGMKGIFAGEAKTEREEEDSLENSSSDIVEKSALHSFSTFAVHMQCSSSLFSQTRISAVSPGGGFHHCPLQFTEHIGLMFPKTNCSENFIKITIAFLACDPANSA